ncbi:MAG TPA: hypothetical protein VFN09_07490 [Rhodanobacteraceae bacterium]|nr:hypothetical protein [Rhodanobacteraceae bacterium]
MRAVVCLAMMVACLPVSSAHAQTSGSAYAIDYDQLYRVDLATRQATLIGAAGNNGPQAIADLSGLTTTPDGTLYAASDTIKSLVRINPSTGQASVVGKFGIVLGTDPTAPLDYAMTAACDGSLWLSSATARQLWKVDPQTGASTLIGSLGRTITGLVVKDDALYGIGGRGEEGWYRIDTRSGTATLIGGLGSMVTYLASASPAVAPNGQMLAALNYVPPPTNTMPADWSDLASIDSGNGVTNVLGTITGPASLRGIGIRGFTTGVPACNRTTAGTTYGVPATSRWALLPLIGGLLLLALWRLRRTALA